MYRDAYGGRVDDRGVVVANAWTNIGPQHVVKLLEMMGVSVCAVELASLSPIMLIQRRRVAAHDDWAFVGDDNWLACLGRGEFHSADDVSRRLDEVLGIVAAVPSSVMPARVDHSVDDFAARIKGLSTIEDALVFLQGLSAEDRERLASSDTPLARFSDVKTPDEAIARFESLDPQQRVQLLAVFQRVDEQ